MHDCTRVSAHVYVCACVWAHACMIVDISICVWQMTVGTPVSVHMCMCEHLSVRMGMPVCGGQPTNVRGFVHLILETGFPAGTWGLQIQLGWLAIQPRDPSTCDLCLCFPALGLRTHQHI